MNSTSDRGTGPDSNKKDAETLRAEIRFQVNFTGGRSTDINVTRAVGIAFEQELFNLLTEEAHDEGAISSPDSVLSSVFAFKTFLEYASLNKLNFIGLSDISVEDIDSYEKFLLKTYGDNLARAWAQINCLIRLLRAADKQRLLKDEFTHRLKVVARYIPFTQYDPKEPLDPEICDQVVHAARRHVNHVRRRIAYGFSLLAQRNESDISWSSIPNILNFIYEDPDGSVSLRKRIAVHRKIYRTYTQFCDLIYLNPYDIFCFATLIAFETGLPIESIYELDEDCLEDVGAVSARLRYIKRRESKSGKRDAPMYLTVSVAGDYSAVYCIRLLKDLTASARGNAAEHERVWLFLGRTPRGRFTPSKVGRVVTRSLKYARALCNRYNIKAPDGSILDGFQPGRIRKTTKVEAYKKDPVRARKVRDHSKTIQDARYLSVKALKRLHETAIENAMMAAINMATNSEIDGNLGDMLEGDSAQGKYENLGVASCKDIKNSPIGSHPESGLCATPVIGCFNCKNAVITRSHLPDILALQKYLIEMRSKIELARWLDLFAKPCAQIQYSILPSFPRAYVEDAMLLTQIQASSVYIPPEYLLG
ncbi:hypothetical protein J2X48_002904 [Bosea sp. BE271]|uniref:hypothetical protein n=1 Tax=Bosea TaxID=85413 RepID=UPI002855CB58|nr:MULTISPECIES: hypothetical protein [Bosea]MDR6828988.1 hypothetical protein [Bosea robiniae]MDR6895872.1 hypothetical protein [Bosea sp. BE109]MDR7139268.1 hypothetical protein [Bosea sp. BE168]MDR7175968.1 hypothetical protein [Bosea sp. BE271]